MNIQFNEAQLSRPQRKSLMEILDVLQFENELELVVTQVEFPIKLKVRLDDEIEMLLGWDAEKESYAGLTTPETVADGVLKRCLDKVAAFREKPNPVEPEPEPDPIPESQKDTADLPKQEPTPELVKSVVGQRVQALAQALVNISKPLNTYQRCEVWMQFCEIYVKGIME